MKLTPAKMVLATAAGVAALRMSGCFQHQPSRPGPPALEELMPAPRKAPSPLHEAPDGGEPAPREEKERDGGAPNEKPSPSNPLREELQTRLALRH